MAYCVHCGVKLENSEKRCPLCDTPVYDPCEGERKQAPSAYPCRSEEQVLQMSKSYLLRLAAWLAFVPAALCAAIDLLFSGLSGWCLYPAAALTLLFFAFALPLILPKHRFTVSYIFVSCAAAGYLLMTSLLLEEKWFLPVALPMTVVTAVLLYLFIKYVQKKRPGLLRSLSALLIGAGLLSVLMDMVIYCYLHSAVHAPAWSLFVAAPCLFMGGLIRIALHKEGVAEELKRRFHF